VKLKNKKIIVNSPAKINLHLEVLGKRRDGYHELSMVMQNINLIDYLEMEFNNNGKLNLSSNNKELSLKEDNLIIKTAEILRNYKHDNNLGANIFLTKNIPIGAGLAGGSSNAAATLIGLNKLWELNFNKTTLHELACQLGSDVPFFLEGGSQYCFGRGEILEKYKFNSEYCLILLKNPRVSISTSDVYKKYFNKFHKEYLSSENQFEKKRQYLRSMGFANKDILKKGILIKNDLEIIVKSENKSVNDALNLFSEIKECLCFSMSGSGPTCYGVFDNYEIAKFVYEKNKEVFAKFGFDAWLCEFLGEGVKFL
tara:strand:+ start:2734 stop:3669 length:936 start_codon:yes stop_codon:yes gene_type:complete